MTVSTTENKVIYDGDGVTTVFAFNFKVFDEDHMKVYLDGIEEPLGWTVTLNPDQTVSPGGEIEFAVAPVADETVTLLREVPLEQLIDYNPYDPFPAETHERGLDLRVMADQQLAEQLDRVYKRPVDAPPGADFLFPDYKAGALIAWSETEENELVNSDTSVAEINQWAQDAQLAAASADASAGAASDSEFNAAESESWAFKWAQEEEDVEVMPGQFSAYHWALKAGQIVSAFNVSTGTPDTLRVLEPEMHSYQIDTLTNQADGLCKLTSSGLVPVELLPFTGLNFYGVFDPADTAPGDNPSDRYPGITFVTGDWWVTGDAGFVTAIDPSDPGGGVISIEVEGGQALLYMDNPAVGPVGWYWISEIGTTTVIAADVAFDDSGTVIPGNNLQVLNENHDAQIESNRTQILSVEGALDAHVTDFGNPHSVTAAQVGADPVGTADAVMAAHVGEADPHPQYLQAADTDVLRKNETAELEVGYTLNECDIITDATLIPIPSIKAMQLWEAPPGQLAIQNMSQIGAVDYLVYAASTFQPTDIAMGTQMDWVEGSVKQLETGKRYLLRASWWGAAQGGTVSIVALED